MLILTDFPFCSLVDKKGKLFVVAVEAVPKYSPSIFLVKLIHFHSTTNPANGGFEREPAEQRTLLTHARLSVGWPGGQRPKVKAEMPGCV